MFATALSLLLTAGTATLALAAPPSEAAAPNASPSRGVQAVALATVEVLPAARVGSQPEPGERHRQRRRNRAGQPIVEFE